MTGQESNQRRSRAPFDGRVPAPDFACFETTRFCNLQCRMCIQFNEGYTVAGPHMGFEAFEQVAHTVFPFLDGWQPSFSGEPLMSRDFDKMVALAERYGVKAQIFTNGTLLDERMIEMLVPNLAALTISFDGASRETYESIRRGASYDQVRSNIAKLVTAVRQRPRETQPTLALNCVLMERTIRELPDVVRMASDLGLDMVTGNHVFPVTPEMKQESLAHHVNVASASITEALIVAQLRNITLRIESLDHITARTATGAGVRRAWSTRDGVVVGLEARSFEAVRRTAVSGERPVSKDESVHTPRTSFPPRRKPDSDRRETESIWWCDLLWNRSYVHVGGNVRPCCIDSVPVMGNLAEAPFDEVWNNENYRALRQRLAAKSPAPACRGCMHIREIRDPVAIDEALQGAAIPTQVDLAPLPPVLQPTRERRRSDPAPHLVWPEVPNATSYTVEFSLDHFESILFSTDADTGGPAIRTPSYTVPTWAWNHAPVDREIQYRVLAHVGGKQREVSSGVLAPDESNACAGSGVQARCTGGGV